MLFKKYVVNKKPEQLFSKTPKCTAKWPLNDAVIALIAVTRHAHKSAHAIPTTPEWYRDKTTLYGLGTGNGSSNTYLTAQ